MATRSVLSELATRYETQTSRTVSAEAGGGVDVAKRIEAGEPVDVVVLASPVIDDLIGRHLLRAGSRVDLVRSGIAIAVPAGRPKPDIGSEEGVLNAVLAAPTLSFSTGPSGLHLRRLFERWGIQERIRDRIIVPPPGVPVAALLARGSADIGFQQLSELSGAGIEVVGPLPPAIQSFTIFSGGISSKCADPAAARALLDFLASPEAAPVKQRHGMEAA